jgi:hypothetical protein
MCFDLVRRQWSTQGTIVSFVLLGTPGNVSSVRGEIVHCLHRMRYGLRPVGYLVDESS